MRLTNANFDYCKRVGMLKENFTREHALKELREDMAETKDMDPSFLAEFEKVTVNSSMPERGLPLCITTTSM